LPLSPTHETFHLKTMWCVHKRKTRLQVHCNILLEHSNYSMNYAKVIYQKVKETTMTWLNHNVHMWPYNWNQTTSITHLTRWWPPPQPLFYLFDHQTYAQFKRSNIIASKFLNAHWVALAKFVELYMRIKCNFVHNM